MNYSHSHNDNPSGHPWLLRHAIFWAIIGVLCLRPVFGSEMVKREVLTIDQFQRVSNQWIDGHGVAIITVGHSNWPLVHPYDLALVEKPCVNQSYQVGMLVAYDPTNWQRNGNGANWFKVGLVQHYVEKVSDDGKYLLTAGFHNEAEDGWIPVANVRFIVRRVIALR